MRAEPGDRRRTRRRDRALVRRMIAGDEAAFERFTDEFVPPLYRFAQRRLGGDRELTREIVQTTLCKAIAKLGSFRGEAGLLTWLCACCRNEIAGHYRRGGRPIREVELDEGELATSAAPGVAAPDAPDRGLLRREQARLVHVALDALPPHYARALEWKYLEGLSVREIARRLELGPKAAESLLTRARNAFRDGFARLGGVGGGKPREINAAGTRTVMQS